MTLNTISILFFFIVDFYDFIIAQFLKIRYLKWSYDDYPNMKYDALTGMI